VVTGGNSAIYGSDAVAGVVNFVLKRNFDGIRIRGQGGISSRGDRGTAFTSITAGKNFADDRGNIAVAFEYANSDPLFNTSRDDLTGVFSGTKGSSRSRTPLASARRRWYSGHGIPYRHPQQWL
jgi:outer membrane receptor protein involved in Fe transport